jgi:hypothetical protein
VTTVAIGRMMDCVSAILKDHGCDGRNIRFLSPGRGEAMQNFVARRNIFRFKGRLANELDSVKREQLKQLLAEEEAKLTGLDPKK